MEFTKVSNPSPLLNKTLRVVLVLQIGLRKDSYGSTRKSMDYAMSMVKHLNLDILLSVLNEVNCTLMLYSLRVGT
jgi:hypothetical protein